MTPILMNRPGKVHEAPFSYAISHMPSLAATYVSVIDGSCIWREKNDTCHVEAARMPTSKEYHRFKA
jgi:hypothetical protein